MLQCSNISACLPEPLFHLFHGHLHGIINDPVHFMKSLPSLLHRYNTWPPFQSRRTHIISVDGKDNRGRPHRNFRVSAQNKEKYLHKDCKQKYRPFHYQISLNKNHLITSYDEHHGEGPLYREKGKPSASEVRTCDAAAGRCTGHHQRYWRNILSCIHMAEEAGS